MTTEELILGHFERALTPQQETLLQERLGASPEARAMYEQHRHLDGYLSSDAMALAPSARLDEMTLAAALGAVPEAIGSGSASWFSGKAVATIAAAVIGGASLALFTTSGPDPVPAPTPAAQSAPVQSAPAQSAPLQGAPTPTAATAPTAETPRSADAAKPAATQHHSGARSTVSNDTRKPRTSTGTKPGLQAPRGSSTVEHPPKVDGK